MTMERTVCAAPCTNLACVKNGTRKENDPGHTSEPLLLVDLRDECEDFTTTSLTGRAERFIEGATVILNDNGYEVYQPYNMESALAVTRGVKVLVIDRTAELGDDEQGFPIYSIEVDGPLKSYLLTTDMFDEVKP